MLRNPYGQTYSVRARTKAHTALAPLRARGIKKGGSTLSRSYSVVCRVAPLKPGNLRGAHVHQTRTHTHDMPNLDPTRLRLNRCLHGSGNVLGDVQTMLDAHPLAHPNGTVCAEMILSADDDYFDSICPGWRDGNSNKKLEGWISRNVEWLKSTYPGLASATLHLDEGAPHIHAMVVPLASYEQKYRRGSKQVTKVHYNRIFGDDAQTIGLARQMKDSELTKLGRLQTAYALAMKPCGLVRGVKNSRAVHQSIREYQALVNTPVITPRIPSLTVIERSVSDAFKSGIGITSDTDKRIEAANAELNKYKNDLRIYQKQLAVKAKEHDTMKAQTEQMRTQLVLKDDTISKLTKELDLTKDQVARLRKYPLQDVATALNYDGSLTLDDGKPCWRNAIDMVKDVAGLDYNQSVAFLYHELGIDNALDAASGHAIDVVHDRVVGIAECKAPRPYTKQEFAIRAELDKQLTHLDSKAYRITMMHADNKMTYNLGKGKGPDDAERLYAKDEVLDLVPKLNNENWRRQYNVFITPLDPDKHYVLIDDLNVNTLRQLKDDGYVPNMVHQSSTLSIQAVIVLPKDKVDKDVGNAFFKDVNTQYGDVSIRGFIHPFRAVGFRNVKPKHKDQATGHFPAVRLMERIQGLCSKALEACRAIALATAALAPGSAPAPSRKTLERHIFDLAPCDVDDSTAAYAARFYTWCEDRWGGNVDWSRADWMLIQRMQKAGHSAELIGATVQACSPGLDERHADRQRYVSATMTVATTRRSPF